MVTGIDPDPFRRPGTRVIHTLQPGDVIQRIARPGRVLAFVVANPSRPPYILNADGSTEKLSATP
jgi:hypothetical protein